MPRLAKGGKWVFGWAVVGGGRQIRLPAEALGEYRLVPGTGIAFIGGSRTSGGFGIGRLEALTGNRWLGKRVIASGSMGRDGLVRLPPEVGAEPGERLLMVRWSGLALGLIRRGPIYRIAQGHPEIEEFAPGRGGETEISP